MAREDGSHKRQRQGQPANVNQLFDRLAGEEQQFLARDVLAPSLGNGRIKVRIGQVICQLRIQPPDVVGFGIFRPASFQEARFLRPATLGERQRYLEIFPLVRLIVANRSGSHWFGSAGSFGDKRVQIEGLARIELPEEIQLFDSIQVRFDGHSFWFDCIDGREDPGAGHYLRASFAQLLPPEQLERPGLRAEQRAAYELNYWWRIRPPNVTNDSSSRPKRPGRRPSAPPRNDAIEQRLVEQLSHAGAQLIGYVERSDGYRVTYQVEGRQYTSAVAKDDLTVQVAGICLSGEDQKFDLSSLVGVLREAEGTMFH